MVKVLRSFRFDGALYAAFDRVVGAGGLTITGALERFMRDCVEADALVFADRDVLVFEVEARVLVDWLCKGKRFYRSESGEEVNIQGRLFTLLPKVQDASLRREVEKALKSSVSLQ